MEGFYVLVIGVSLFAIGVAVYFAIQDYRAKKHKPH
jgi:hypothetical protein